MGHGRGRGVGGLPEPHWAVVAAVVGLFLAFVVVMSLLGWPAPPGSPPGR